MVSPLIIAAAITAAGMIISALPSLLQWLQAPQLLERAEELQRQQAEASQQMMVNMMTMMYMFMLPMMMMQLMMNMMAGLMRPIARPPGLLGAGVY